MRTIKGGAAEKRGIEYSPNATTLVINSRQTTLLLDISHPPDHCFEHPSPNKWSIVVTDPQAARKDIQILERHSQSLEE